MPAHADDRLSLASALPLNRRAFAASSLAAGFAAATMPVAASAIATSADGLDAGEVSIQSFDRAIPGYRARPKGGKNEPVILVVQEIFGVHEHIRDLCRRFAREGYYAIAAELYLRQGDVSQLTEIRDIVDQVVSKVPDAQVMQDLDAAAAHAAGDGADAARLGVTGFCWGGRITWLYAAHNPKLKAGVAWYGRLVESGGPNPNMPRYPVDIAGELKAPVLGLYGGQDQGIPLDTVERMETALKAAGSPSRIHVYPDAPHGFLADYRATYKADDAADGWKRCLAWFREHGVG